MKATPSKKDTQQALIEAAIELYAHKESVKINDFSVADVCKQANVTRNAFYYYFENKDVFFNAVGDWVTSQSQERALAALGQESSYQQFWEFYRAFLQLQCELGPFIMNMVCISRVEKGVPDYCSYIDDQISQPMLKLITNAQKNGEINSSASPSDLLTTSYTVVRGVNIHWCFQWGAYDLIEKARHELDILFRPNPGFELK